MLVDSCESSVMTVPVRIRDYWYGQWGDHPAQCHLSGYPDTLAMQIASELINVNENAETSPKNYLEWCYRYLGKTFSEHFQLPYSRKFWGVEAMELTCDWMEHRVVVPSVLELEAAMRGEKVAHQHYVQEVLYPQIGGFGAFLRGLAAGTQILYGVRIESIDTRNHLISTNLGHIRYRNAISTIPLPTLIPLITAVPPNIQLAACKLRATTATFINLAINRPHVLPEHWVYVYDADIPFSRVSSPTEWSSHNGPKDTSSLQLEIYSSQFQSNSSVQVKECVRALRRMMILQADDKVTFAKIEIQQFANVIYDHFRRDAVSAVHEFLHDQGINFAGRYSTWDYSLLDQNVRQAWTCVDNIIG